MALHIDGLGPAWKNKSHPFPLCFYVEWSADHISRQRKEVSVYMGTGRQPLERKVPGFITNKSSNLILAIRYQTFRTDLDDNSED